MYNLVTNSLKITIIIIICDAKNATLREVMRIFAKKSTTATATALVVVEKDGSGRFYVFCASSARTHY